jgi:hypothetical protein
MLSVNLLAVVTGGDLLHAILAGRSLDFPAVEIGNHKFTSVRPDTHRANMVALMLDKSFKCLYDGD